MVHKFKNDISEVFISTILNVSCPI
jgi:hypothetical protein